MLDQSRSNAQQSQSVPVSQGVILRGHNQAFSFAGPAVDDFADIDQVLRLFEDPVDLIIVAGAGVDHDVLVAIEEHQSHLVVELVHGVEIRYFSNIHDIKGDEVAELIGYLHDDFVHNHAGRVPVVTPPDHY